MPLLDHFHPPLRGPRRWEGFHHAWAANLAQHLNRQVLPADFFAEPEISLGRAPGSSHRPDVCEVRVYGGTDEAQLRAAIELICPANKDSPGGRQAFAAKCAGYLGHAVSVIIIDVVTEGKASLHADLLEVLEIPQSSWESPSQLYAIAYRPIRVQNQPRIAAWAEVLTLGQSLPILPVWLRSEMCLPLRLEETYAMTCSGLRLPT